MYLDIFRLNYKDTVKGFIIGVIVAIITFPENDWIFSVGIDPSLKWLYNWLFENGLSVGKSIIFPHGPLAFVMYPLQENIIIAMLFLSLLKIMLAVSVTKLIDKQEWTKWIYVFLFTYLISIIAGVNHIILATIILLYCNYFKYQNPTYKILAFVITAIAFYIKSYVAVISAVLCFSFMFYNFFFWHKNLKKAGFDVVLVTVFILGLWVMMYGNLSGFTGYIVGMFYLAQDNSSAASYYPQNNWFFLVIFLIITFGLPFINRTKRAFFFGMLVTLSVFAAWKHGMGREDIYHAKGLLVYVTIVLFSFIIFNQKSWLKNLVLTATAIFMFFLNIRNVVNYSSYRFEFNSPGNFIEFVSDFSSLKNKSFQENKENISVNELPKPIRDSINSATVDVYPWDYSIIPANNLNWQPRPVIQSYASYVSWLDKKNSAHFASDKAPEFIIWELDKVSKDVNGSNFNSIDNRYLLNDEPQTIIQVLKYYRPFYSGHKFFILKKREDPIHHKSFNHGTDTTTWGDWIPVPNQSTSLLRAKIDFKKSILQRLKSFLYKDEQFWIYLKSKNGIIHKYRIVPKNAKDGIWVNPYIFDLNKIAEVEEVMFKCSNEKIIDKNINIAWEQIQFEDNPCYIDDFFKDGELKNDSIVFSSSNEFEGLQVPYWKSIPDSQQVDGYAGTKAYLVNPKSFSTDFSYSLDSIPFGQYKFSIDCWAKSLKYDYSGSTILVLAINDEQDNIVWRGISIDEQLIDRSSWNNIFNFTEYEHNKSNCILKGYVWNTSDKEVVIDNFRVMFLKGN